MADEYQQPQLHRHHHHESEEEGSKIETIDDTKTFTGFSTANDDVATTDAKDGSDVEARDRGLFGNFTKVDVNEEVKDDVAKETVMGDATNEVVGDESAVEGKDRGLFGNFTGRKEEEVNEVATEFGKVNVSEEPKEEKEEKKLVSHSNSLSSSSDEEDGVEGEEKKKKKKKKGMKDKIKDMVSGGSEKAEIKTNNKEVEEAAYVEPTEAAYADTVSDQAEEKTGFVHQTNEKIGDTENAPTTPRSKGDVAKNEEPETKEKKGIFEKIKEKIPGYQTKPAEN